MINKYKNNETGFTLIELLIVIVIISVLAAIVYTVINPRKRMAEARNAVRFVEVKSILDALRKHQVENNGVLASGIDSTYKMLGTDGTGCNVGMGESSAIEYHNDTENLNYYINNSYSVRNWFNASGVDDFSSMTVSVALDCNGGCSGSVRVRIGNASSYSDYDLTDSSFVRTDGTTSDYSWYDNTFSVSKSSVGNYFFVQLLIYNGTGTVRFLMDEAGPSGPDPEFRSGSNGDGSQAGWTNDNGDYFIKISVGEATAVACLDLSSALVDQYISEIPQDPSTGTAGKTYYAIKENSGSSLQVISLSSELDVSISTGG